MNNAELAEIRARLAAAAQDEGARPRNPLLGAVRAVLRPPAPATPPKPSYPPPRRVGLTPTRVAEEEEAELLLTGPLAAEAEPRRNAFGQRPDPAREPVTLLLAAPEPEIPAAELAHSWSAVLARPRPAAAVTETPYHPEDVADLTEGEAERLYAAAGLPKVGPDPPRDRPTAMRRTAPAKPPPPLTPEQELLTHLERLLLVELAAVEAVRLPG